MIINTQLLDSLTEQAKANPRLRQAYDLRTTPDDNSQRILNAMEPGTVLPIHRHRGSTETITVLRGKVVQHLYDAEGRLQESIVMAPASAVVAMSVEVGQWHKAESLESGTVILECKDGKYTPLTEEDILHE
ncbi:MAG: WbuC family cupin fold metalloprotein [Bacteroidales bacterium]|nr:WbuC family cupin fold metalloprotein [Bacteroidales bacterium]